MNGNGSANKGALSSIIILTVILCAIVASIIVIAFKIAGGEPDVTTDPSSTSAGTTAGNDTTTGVANGFKSQTYTESDVHIGTLAIVNSSNAYNFDAYKNTDAKLYDSIPALNGVNANRGASSGFYSAADGTVSLRADVITALNKMFAAFNADIGRNDVLVWIGHRTFEDQQKKYNAASEAGKKNMAAPGYTEYHTGYAFQLQLYTAEFNSDPANTEKSPYTIARDEATNNWFNLHAHEYGFIVRYPAGKGDTDFSAGMDGVFRYVGIPHATYMWENNLCFEEYLKLVEKKTFDAPLEIKISDDEIYSVYSADGTEIYVPKEKPYSVSGNNSDGFIVTVTEK